MLFNIPRDEINNDSDGTYFYDRNYDPATGLCRPWFASTKAFQDGYNARVRDLVKTQGVPSWGVNCEFRADEFSNPRTLPI